MSDVCKPTKYSRFVESQILRQMFSCTMTFCARLPGFSYPWFCCLQFPTKIICYCTYILQKINFWQWGEIFLNKISVDNLQKIFDGMDYLK